MTDHEAPRWRRWGGRVILAAGLAVAMSGAGAGAAIASSATPYPATAPAGEPAIQPVYWAYDGYGRRIWVEPRYYRPPPPYYRHGYRHHEPRRGWVDRHGRWHRY